MIKINLRMLKSKLKTYLNYPNLELLKVMYFKMKEDADA
jgi:hypothetical protein